jgi:hypothetical protein
MQSNTALREHIQFTGVARRWSGLDAQKKQRIDADLAPSCVVMSTGVPMTKDAATKSINVPVDVEQWLQDRARYNGASISSEVTRSLRMRMEAEAKSGRSASTSAA